MNKIILEEKDNRCCLKNFKNGVCVAKAYVIGWDYSQTLEYINKLIADEKAYLKENELESVTLEDAISEGFTSINEFEETILGQNTSQLNDYKNCLLKSSKTAFVDLIERDFSAEGSEGSGRELIDRIKESYDNILLVCCEPLEDYWAENSIYPLWQDYYQYGVYSKSQI